MVLGLLLWSNYVWVLKQAIRICLPFGSMMPNKKDIKVSCFLAEWYFTYIHFFWIKNLQCKLGSFLCFVGFKCQGTTKFSETGQKIAFDCQIIPYHRKPFSSVMFLGGQDGTKSPMPKTKNGVWSTPPRKSKCGTIFQFVF